MAKSIVTAALMVVMATAASVAQAQDVADGPAEIINARIKAGDTVYVTDASGERVKGKFDGLSEGTLRMSINGELRKVAMSDVREVARRGDSLWNGVLIGATIGAIGGAAAASHCSELPDLCGQTQTMMAVALVYGGIGAGIDALIPGRTRIYQASPASAVRISPVVSRRRQGLQVSVGF